MSTGFVTASGKGVNVSEESLERARKLFDCIDDEIKNDAESCASPSVPLGPFINRYLLVINGALFCIREDQIFLNQNIILRTMYDFSDLSKFCLSTH